MYIRKKSIESDSIDYLNKIVKAQYQEYLSTYQYTYTNIVNLCKGRNIFIGWISRNQDF